ncbi:DUF4145 domain-containing protein [Pectobacterium versatile]|uniref:DUF4145 domain-containing protein n=1 Tax=Pectobacterium TaxID=122277 RepID=UPI0015E0170D|nr:MULTISPECIES: DUF4145 domain-containing protein [Pectobacterium]MBA0182696.1 DUF4145 domain-containing protein [Pectobacterium versatile]MBD0848799.1 hypothetical protein [Pectobacterium carotovorum subsp. carotovorum]MBK4825923.1 hypothetical protein [Pectobacterium carotovorum subsp. carotovorum]UNE77900.1 DUF4145 domain-containing protein [Pectobacterium versatile]
MTYIAPSFYIDAFHCPKCGVFSHMNWLQLRDSHGRNQWQHYYAICSHCESYSLWRKTKNESASESASGIMIEPDTGSSPLPDPAMPENVKKDYIEAAQIFQKSPRGSAALLRLALQKLCKHLGEKGKNIDEDIRELAKKHTIPPLIVKVADTVRITGNNAVHPGEMSDEDVDYVASKMFELINIIVRKGISEPQEIKALYEITPEAPRKAAEKKDSAGQGNEA